MLRKWSNNPRNKIFLEAIDEMYTEFYIRYH